MKTYFKKNWLLLLFALWILLTPLLAISVYERWFTLIAVISIIMTLICISYLVFAVLKAIKPGVPYSRG